MHEAVVDTLLKAGPPFWLAAVLLVAVIVLSTAVWRLVAARAAEVKEMTAALVASIRAIEAATEDREELAALVRENHHATMLGFAEQAKALAIARAESGGRCERGR